MTKVLFLAHTAAPSGAELALARMVGAMSTTDVSVAFTEDGPMVSMLREQNIDVLDMSGSFDSSKMTIRDSSMMGLVRGAADLVRIGWRLGGIARDSSTDVIVAETTKALIMGAVASRRARVPLIWHTHDRISVEYFGRALAVIIRTLGWIVSSAYIANSELTRESLYKWRRPSLVAYPGVELTANTGAGERDSTPRQPEDLTLCVVGRLTSWKGQDVFLRALAESKVLPKQVLLVGGTFFGEESYQLELENLARELELPVTFTGHVDNPQDYMRRSDILVHCSVMAEPFGQVVVEGLHAGCAVIASTPGGTAEIVQDGINGILVESGDQRQLTQAIEILMLDSDLRERFAIEGPKRAQNFDVVDSARAVEHFVADIAAVREPQLSADG